MAMGSQTWSCSGVTGPGRAGLTPAAPARRRRSRLTAPLPSPLIRAERRSSVVSSVDGPAGLHDGVHAIRTGRVGAGRHEVAAAIHQGQVTAEKVGPGGVPVDVAGVEDIGGPVDDRSADQATVASGVAGNDVSGNGPVPAEIDAGDVGAIGVLLDPN